jgi:hypothetical protein
VLPLLEKHFENQCSSDTDAQYLAAMEALTPETDKNFVFELPGGVFKIYNGKILRRGKRRKL